MPEVRRLKFPIDFQDKEGGINSVKLPLANSLESITNVVKDSEKLPESFQLAEHK